MLTSKRRGSRVVYVASSARDLPEEVQEWLSQAGHAATACSNIYEALALLATGRRPAVLIVNIDTVDWEEMEFFDHAARLAVGTEILVAGHQHAREKIDAACARGARVFDPDTAGMELKASGGWSAGGGGLLAGSLRWQGPGVPDKPPEQQATDKAEPATTPQVRLVTPVETEDENSQEQETTFPLPVPWVENPQRPKRTPPAASGRPGGEPGSAVGRGAGQGIEAQHPSPVELTPEELAALLAKPSGASSAAKERRR